MLNNKKNNKKKILNKKNGIYNSRNISTNNSINPSKKYSKSPYIFELSIDNSNKIIKNEKIDSLLEYSPLSGSELEYNPGLWNDNYDIKSTHNCYTYALGKIIPGLDSKAQPGYASGYKHIDDDDYKCSSFKERLKKDSPVTYLEKFDKSCLPGFYKIFLALDPKNDYHWWRQNSDKYWSHKPGGTDVTDVDSDGNKIKNPLKANRNYGSLNYYKPCFFACVYSDLSRSISNIYNIKKY